MVDMTVTEFTPQGGARMQEERRAPGARGVTSSFTGLEQPTAASMISSLFAQYAPLAYQLPWQTLDYVELLSTYNPDYSQAVENIKMLANSGHNLYVDASSSLKRRRIKAILEERARHLQERHGGVDGIIDKLLDQAATFGAMCGEIVLSENLRDVVDFIDLNPKKIRFFWDQDQNRYRPFQKVTGAQLEEAKASGQFTLNGCVLLNEETFHYFAFDAAPESPYGTPPFLASLANIAIQRDMISNMAQIVKKIGLLGVVDLSIKSLQPLAGESNDAFTARATKYLDAYVQAGEDMAREGGLVHFDDVTATTFNIGGNAAGATNIHKANEELIFSGLKSMPSVQGRCLDPNTVVLSADGTTKLLSEVETGDLLQGFDENTGSARRRWKTAKVENVWSVRKESLRLHLSNGRSVMCSEDHPFLMQKQNAGAQKVDRTTGSLTSRRDAAQRAAEGRWRPSLLADEFQGTDWSRAKDIREGEWIKALNMPVLVNYDSEDYKAGYLGGANSGDGCFRIKSPGKQGYWQMASQVSDDTTIDRCEQFAEDLGLGVRFSRTIRPPNINPTGSSFAGTQPMTILKMTREVGVNFLVALNDHRDSDDYRAGWLAGMFDTDGCLHSRDRGREQLRFCQKDGVNKDRIERYLADLGFVTTRHTPWIEVLGDRLEKWRLTASIRPALDRKMVRLEDRTVRTFKPVRVVKIEKVGEQDLIDITTTTSTFVGDGLLTHNSYSTTETYAGVAYDIIIRNTHKYQRGCKRMIESIYWTILNLSGEDLPDSISLEFEENRSLNRLQEANAIKTEIQNAFFKWVMGIIDQNGVAQELGYSEPKIPLAVPPDALTGSLTAHGIDEGGFPVETPTTTKLEVDDGESEN